MKIRKIYRETFVSYPKNEVFAFFADPENLLKVTPSNFPMTILNENEVEMKKGAIIDMKIKLFGFFPVKWKTKISEWSPPDYFVDIQPKGPYRYWKHTHKFLDKEGGTLIVDDLEYSVPGYFLEPVIHKLIVKNNLLDLFDYRQNVYQKVLELEQNKLSNTNIN